MKKLLTIVFALALGSSLSFAQAASSTPADKSATKKASSKKKSSKKAAKKGADKKDGDAAAAPKK
jgi:hypothetical protein